MAKKLMGRLLSALGIAMLAGAMMTLMEQPAGADGRTVCKSVCCCHGCGDTCECDGPGCRYIPPSIP